MNLFDIAPLLSVIIGALLFIFILFRKTGLGKSKKIRYVLAAIVFLYTFTALDYYITIKYEGQTSYFGLSYLFIHLLGFLLYYFVALFIKAEINIKKWLTVFSVFTVLRWLFFLPVFEYSSLQEFIVFTKENRYDELLELEFLITSIINIILFFLAFLRFKKSPVHIKLNNTEKFKYNWINLVLLAFIVLQLAVIIGEIITRVTIENDVTFEIYKSNMQFETLLIALFFFVFTYSIIQFPVFAFTGDFEDLPIVTQNKYAKSSLKDASELFNEIDDLVRTKKLYLDFDLKLNTIAESLDKSIHHVSQAINQSSGMGFPDYINSFRIDLAKEKLLEPKLDTIYAISLDVGFNSKAAFYTAFKKFTSQTPTEFKKANKNNL